MVKFQRILAPLLAGLLVAAPGAVLAHSKVVSSTPAEGATAKSVKAVTLTFNESMIPATTATQLVMTAMPGMANHGTMQVKNFTSAWSKDNKTLTLKLKNALKPGTYEARWQGAGADGHRMNGKVTFKVA